MHTDSFSVQIIKDSISLQGVRLTTFLVTYPRFIHSETMTHRALSRNSSSCLSGDTMVYTTHPNGALMKVAIQDLYNKFVAGASRDEMSVRTLNEDTGEFTVTTIKNVIHSGIKDVFRVELEGGYVLKCTDEHRIFTDHGWKTLKDMGLSVGKLISWSDAYKIATNGVELLLKNSHFSTGRKLVCKYEKILKIEYVGAIDTYDIEVNGKYKNFVANGVVVHNSRAIPFKRMVKNTLSNMGRPLSFKSNKPGMQAGEALSPWREFLCSLFWKLGGYFSAYCVSWPMHLLGAHKQYVNRPLEPYSTITVVISATDYNNFFALRDHKDAQPEIQYLAKQMKRALSESEPEVLERGQWHLPFVLPFEQELLSTQEAINLSIARCARTSYNNFDGKPAPFEKDLELCNKLLKSEPLHASPAEHQGTPALTAEYKSGNFRGWEQYRKQLPNENVPG